MANLFDDDFDDDIDTPLEPSTPLEYESGEQAFLNGEIIEGFISSHVTWFYYRNKHRQLKVGYLDKSVYEYDEISESEALAIYHAPSKGTWIWDELRLRGTVFGFKKNYRLVTGTTELGEMSEFWQELFGGKTKWSGQPRAWMLTKESRKRHAAIPASGEPPGYHPLFSH